MGKKGYGEEEKNLNGTAQINKCKPLFEYQHLSLLRDFWWSKFYLYLNVVHFFNTSVN